MLPAIWVANRAISQPDPPALVLLDQHAELASWDESSEVHAELLSATGVDDVLNHCEIDDKRGCDTTVHDGNWLSAAVNLG